MKLFSTYWLALCLSLTAFLVHAQVANDDCPGAFVLTAGNGQECISTPGSSLAATPTTGLPPGCCSVVNGDVWYRFTATATSHFININEIRPFGFNANSGAYGGIEVYSGDCNNLEWLSSQLNYSSIALYLDNLVVGESYYFRVFGVNSYTEIEFSVCITSPAPSQNDECAQAQVIIPEAGLNCNYVSSTTLGSSMSLPDCLGAENTSDIWFRFTATSEQHALSYYSAYNAATSYELLTGVCGNLTSLDCFAGNAATPQIFQGLTIGQDYFLRFSVGDNQFTDINLCLLTLPPAPINDECEGALPLLVNAGLSCTLNNQSATLGATTSILSCSGGNDNDVWHSFVASGEQMVFSIANNNLGSIGYYYSYGAAIYSGSCGALNELVCNIVNPYYFQTPALIPGETYYLRVFSYENTGHTFDICAITLPPSPPNTSCGTALPVTANAGNDCTVTFHGSTTGAVINPFSCSNGPSLYYSFTANTSAYLVSFLNVMAELNTGDAQFGVFASGACESGTPFFCRSVSAIPTYLDNLVVGETYYMVVSSPQLAGINFDLCLREVAPPANDHCADAISLPVNADMTCSSTVNATSYGAGVEDGPACVQNAEVWFSFTATQSAHSVVLNNVSYATEGSSYSYPYSYSFAVFAGSCAEKVIYTCNTNYGVNNPISLGGLVAGETYYISIAPSSFYEAINFDICVLTPPPPPLNDECVQPIQLPVSVGENCETYTTGTTVNANPTANFPALYQLENYDVWYSFTATQTNHNLIFNNVYHANYFYNTSIQVEVGTADCANPSFFSLYNYASSGTSLWVTGLQPGETYLIRIITPFNNPVNFDICITSPAPPANDHCENAIPIPVNENLICENIVQGTTFGSAPSGLGNCAPAGATDVWYSFEATGSVYRFEVSIGNTATEGFELLTGDCNNLTSVFCSFGSYGQQTVFGLIPGNTYFLRLFSLSEQPFYFNACVIKFPEPPVNDACLQAISVVPNVGTACTNVYPGTTLSAISEPVNSNCISNQPDVWYTFTANENGYLLSLENFQPLFGYSLSPLLEIYSGDCNNLAYEQCFYNIGNPVFLPTVPGTVYWVRVANQYENNYFSFDFCVRPVPPSTPNTNCFAAVALIPASGLSCEQTAPGSTAGITQVSYGNCGLGHSIWYSFTATSAIHYISTPNKTHVYGNENLLADLIIGNDCSNLEFVTCHNLSEFPSQINNLVPGQQYYLRVYSPVGAGDIFDICITTVPPPPNDHCADAVILPVNPDQNCAMATSGTTFGAGIDAGDFCFINNVGVWYQFTATATVHSIAVANALNSVYYTAEPFNIEVFSGNCTALEPVACRYYLYSYYNSEQLIGDLTPGETYYIRISEANSFFNFDICILTPTLATPVNDACGAAISLTPEPGQECLSSVAGTTLDATPSWLGYYQSEIYNDVWYTFVATDATHQVNISNVTTNYGYWEYVGGAVFVGSCPGEMPIITFNYYFTGSTLLTNLVPGETYTVRVYSGGYNNTPINFDICVTTVPAPDNDECANAQVLSYANGLYCDFINTGNNFGATTSQIGCENAGSTDVWYQFTAPSSSTRIEFSASFSNYNYNVTDQGYEIFEGSCGNLVSLGCFNTSYQISTFTGLTPGNTYFIRVFSGVNTSINFSFCLIGLPEPPANDGCESAESIPVNSGVLCDLYTTGTTLGATSTMPACYNNAVVYDVWYNFTAQSTGHVIDLSVLQNYFNSYNNIGIQVFSGDCNNLQSVVCYQNVDNISFPLLGLTEGQQYFIRVFSNENFACDFLLCLKTLPPTPANLSCNTAETVVPNSGTECIEFVSGNTASVPETTYGACYASSNAVWYTFTATSSFHVISLSNVISVFGNGTPEVTVFEGYDCGALNPINCSLGNTEIQLPGLVVGDPYYIRIAGSYSGAIAYDLCIKTYPTPANDECSGATTLAVYPDLNCVSTNAGTTVGGTPSALASCNIYSADTWYSFEATQGSHIVTLSNVQQFLLPYAVYFNVEIYEGDCNNLILKRCFSSLYNSSNLLIGDLSAGSTYWVRIGGYTELINYEICITTPPPPPANDACASALSLAVSQGAECTTMTAGTTQYATASSPVIPYYESSNDVWYTFVATQEVHSIQISEIEYAEYGSPTTLYYAVYAGTCSAPELITFNSVYNSGIVYLSSLEAGVTYWVRILDYNLYPTNFNICITTPPPPANDECAGALPLMVNTGYNCDVFNTGSMLGATTSTPTNCLSVSSNDIWYTFVPATTDLRIDFSASGYFSNSDYGYEVMQGDCNGLSTLVCGAAYQFIDLHDLVVGETYYMRVFAKEDITFDFSICLFPLPPAPVNDACENAIVVPVNSGMECAVVETVFTGGATNSGYYNCYYGPDIWYRFTATAEQHILSMTDLVNNYGYTSPVFELYAASDCNSLGGPVACGNALDNFLNGLVAGNDYWLRIVGNENSGATFNLCLRTVLPVENDECAFATPIIPTEGIFCNEFVPGTTVGATVSPNYQGCFGGQNDVWYSFTATNENHALNITGLNNQNSYFYFDLFLGDCAVPEPVNCYSSYNNAQVYLGGLIVGQNYLIRVSEYSYGYPAFFGLCISDYPVDLIAYGVNNGLGQCSQGIAQSIYVQAYNNSPVTIPVGTVSASIELSGSNTGSYGPFTNIQPIYPYSIGYIAYESVVFPNSGPTTLTGTISHSDDVSANDNSVTNTVDILPAMTIYADNDLDGFGNDQYTYTQCVGEVYYGYSTIAGDCDDNNSLIYPNATEYCNGVDDDCDGEIDETTLDIIAEAGLIPCGGTITLLEAVGTGGVPPYTYSLDSAAFEVNNLWGVGAGTHLVIVRDNAGCGVSTEVTVAPPNNIIVDPVVVTHVSCAGGNTGAINITVSGGSGTYTYLWSNSKTTQDIQNLAAGTYTVTVTDNQGCTTVSSAVVNPKLSLATTKTNSNCNNSNDGTATAIANGGTPAYTYLWSTGATVATITNLSPGNYTVTLTDALGCTKKATVTISQPGVINIGSAITNATCFGQPGGAINLTVSNGVAPYSYLWSDGATTEDRAAIIGGTYTVTVTGSNGCTQKKTMTVGEPAPIYITFSVTKPSCYGSANGEITANVNGGTKYPANNPCNGERYCFSWSTGGVAKKISGLVVGTYTLTITDFNGCTASASVTVTQPDELLISNLGAQLLNNGKYKVTITATGGTSPYLYKRIPGPSGYQTSPIFNNVSPGTYQFIVRDNNACTDTLSAVLPVMFSGPGADERAVIPETNLTITVSPNPAAVVARVNLSHAIESGNVKVYDALGRLVLEQGFSGASLDIPVENWQDGIYLVEVRVGEERFVRKISVKRP